MTKQMKKILTILSLTLIFAIAVTSSVIAYLSGVRGLGILGISFFFTAAVVIVLAQLIPAGILLVLMIKSALFPVARIPAPARARN